MSEFIEFYKPLLEWKIISFFTGISIGVLIVFFRGVIIKPKSVLIMSVKDYWGKYWGGVKLALLGIEIILLGFSIYQVGLKPFMFLVITGIGTGIGWFIGGTSGDKQNIKQVWIWALIGAAIGGAIFFFPMVYVAVFIFGW